MRTLSRGGTGATQRAVTTAGILALLQLLFFAGLVAAQALPDDVIVDRLHESVRDGSYGTTRMPDRMGGRGLTFTDCVELGTGVGARPGESLIHQAARMPRLGNCRIGAEQISTLAQGGEVDEGEYFRYWAGYVVLTRPALALVGVEGLRMLVGALLGASLIAAWRALSLGAGAWAATTLVAPLLLATNLLAMPVVGFSHALSTSIGLLGITAVALAARSSPHLGLRWVVISAAAYCYVDLLTNPPVWWLLSAFTFAAVAWTRQRTLSAAVAAVLTAGIAWPVSFALTWVSRWLIALVVLGPDRTLDQILGKVGQRTTGAAGGRSVDGLSGLRSNWQHWWETVPTSRLSLAVLVLVVLVTLALAVAQQRTGAVFLLFVVLSSPALVAVAWLLIVNEHSVVHVHFTYRVIPAALGVVAASAVLVWRPRREPGRSAVRAGASTQNPSAEQLAER